ncbi:MAG: hypothetical protein MI743_21205 [Sneathiellales bacterium]|nr:hypothetical protein [Sneathiellales bacterium]
MQGFFLAAHGLQGFLAAHGLQGFFLAAQGLQGLHAFAFLAAQGLQDATTTPSALEAACAAGMAAIDAAERAVRPKAVTLRDFFNMVFSSILNLLIVLKKQAPLPLSKDRRMWVKFQLVAVSHGYILCMLLFCGDILATFGQFSARPYAPGYSANLFPLL